MRLELTGRHVTITPAIRRAVDQQLKHALRMLNDSAVSGQVVFTREKTRVHCDATVHARGEKFLHGEATGRDMESALAAAVDKIDRQAQKLKGKWNGRKRRDKGVAEPPIAERRSVDGDGVAGDGDAEAIRIVRARRYAVKPMTIDEAAMDIVERDEAFLVFRNAATEEVTVLFRRPDGNIGLIEP